MEDCKQMNLFNDNCYMVVQHNSFIRASYDMTALEQKLLLILISTIREDSDFVQIQFKVQDLANAMGITSESLYRDLKKICKKIMTRIIEIQDIETGAWKIFNIIKYAEYVPKSGSIILEINEKSKTYLLDLKEFFTSYKLNNTLALDSKYAIRMYQLSKECLYKGKEYYALEDFKKILKIDDKKTYNRANSITSNILNPSKEEINSKTDIVVDFNLRLQGRKAIGVDITCKEKQKNNGHKKDSYGNYTGNNSKRLKKLANQNQNREYDSLERQLLGWDLDEAATGMDD